MKSRPILMSAPMVLATLGDLKTQSRRIATLTSGGHVKEVGGHRRWHPDDPDAVLACPYGQPGDELWVKETWGVSNACYGKGNNWVSVGYRAQVRSYYNPENWRDEIDVSEEVAHRYFDEFCEEACKANGGDMPEGEGYEIFRWRPSIHMPRWASRIRLRVVSRRLERLQDITTADARAEGICRRELSFADAGLVYRGSEGTPERATAIDAFADLWELIYGPGSWAANPRVWRVEFRRVEGGE